MAECHKCKSSIRGETGISCDGVCKKVYHTVKCAGVDQYTARTLEADNFLRFMCGDCVQYIHNVDMVVKDIQDSVNKNKQNLIEYKLEFDSALKRNENEIKQLLEAIEKRYEERLRKIDKAQKICETNFEEIKNLCGMVKEYENKSNDIFNNIEENNVKICNEIKKIIKETNDKQNKMSFADALKKNTVLPELKKQVPLIVKPKEKQNLQKTKEDLNNKVDPKNFKITNVENRSNGTLVIQSENNEEREKIKTAIQNEMGEGYEIKVPNNHEMSVTITDMTFKYSNNELIEKIKKQNEFLKESEIKPVKSYEFKRNNKLIYNTKIVIDNDSYTKLLSAQRINIGWEKCRVFDGTDVLMCYKCRGFNHKAGDCKNQEICYKCHGNHKAKECNKDIIPKCINCIKSNEKLNLGLDENHSTLSKECPVYQNKLNLKMRRMGFDI